MGLGEFRDESTDLKEECSEDKRDAGVIDGIDGLESWGARYDTESLWSDERISDQAHLKGYPTRLRGLQGYRTRVSVSGQVNRTRVSESDLMKGDQTKLTIWRAIPFHERSPKLWPSPQPKGSRVPAGG